MSLPRRRVRRHRRRHRRPAAGTAGDPDDPHRRQPGPGPALMKWLDGLVDWLDSRTGIRTARKHLLDEPLPAGVGWWFVTGSILLMLLAVQLVTGIVLTFYYVPAPDHAYDSVRFITDGVPFGRIVRGLHYFGASFVVIAAVIHMLRVVLLGSY